MGPLCIWPFGWDGTSLCLAFRIGPLCVWPFGWDFSVSDLSDWTSLYLAFWMGPLCIWPFGWDFNVWSFETGLSVSDPLGGSFQCVVLQKGPLSVWSLRRTSQCLVSEKDFSVSGLSERTSTSGLSKRGSQYLVLWMGLLSIWSFGWDLSVFCASEKDLNICSFERDLSPFRKGPQRLLFRKGPFTVWLSGWDLSVAGSSGGISQYLGLQKGPERPVFRNRTLSVWSFGWEL